MPRDSCAVLSCALLQEYRKGGSARAAMAWEWRKRGSMPQGEDSHADVAQRYEEVRAAMDLGESLFARGATDKSMQGLHSGWNEAYGLYQVPRVCAFVFLCVCASAYACVPVCARACNRGRE